MEKEQPSPLEKNSLSTEKVDEIMDKNLELYNAINNPWLLIRKGGSLGIKGVGRLIGIIILFAISNIVLFFLFPFIKFFVVEYKQENIVFLLIILIAGVSFTSLAGYKAYKYVILDTVRIIYENSEQLFLKLIGLVVNKLDELAKSKVDLNNANLKKAINFTQVVNEKFKKAPKIVQKGIVLILNRIPLTELVTEFKEDIMSGNKEEVTIKLHRKIDGFISETIFGGNNTNWIFWLLPLNLITIIILTIFLIK